MDSHSSVTHQQITERARRLWEERGKPEGRDLEHWLDAERQLQKPGARAPSGARPPPQDLVEAEKRLDGLIEPPPSPARRTPKGEQL